MFFNGFTLLLMIIAFLGGSVWNHYLTKSLAKSAAQAHERNRQADLATGTPIASKLARDMGIDLPANNNLSIS
jgi:hypothetical protein